MSSESFGQVELFLASEYKHLNLVRLGSLLEFAAREEQIQGGVSIKVCNDDEIARLHQQFMGIAGPTDVMSFPGESGEPHATGFGQGEAYLGDIVVSFETAERQAVEFRNSAEREIIFLILHGFLHLAGYDDLGPGEREAMLARQTALLETFEKEHPGDWG